MELSLFNLFYLFFRISPFIIVCFFSLSSLINQDVKAFIYLVGLIFACFINYLVGSMLSSLFDMPDGPPVCNILTMGDFAIPVRIPFGICILGFTFCYMVYAISKYNLAGNNIPILILFPLLIIADFLWNLSNNCYGLISILVSLGIGCLLGVWWGYFIINTMKSPQVHYIGMFTNTQICSRPATTVFKCTFNELTQPTTR